jgi:hypothetical protein
MLGKVNEIVIGFFDDADENIQETDNFQTYIKLTYGNITVSSIFGFRFLQ